MYSEKIIQNLKPSWYLDLGKGEKLQIQKELRERHKEEWINKPTLLRLGTQVTAKESVKGITKDRKYTIQGHFCTLVTTIYDSCWNQFITFKNDNGWTVKMNLNKFKVL